MAKKAVEKKESANALASASGDFDQYAGAGMEAVTSDDILIPRLAILQKLSPQISPKKGEFIEGAEVGMICDVGTEELFPDGVIFLPVFFSKVWLEWAPRATQKGLVKIHHNDAITSHCSINDRNQPILPNGNSIAETAQMFGLNISANLRRSFIPFGSSQLKKSRRWLTLATGEELARSDGSTFTPPLFYRSYNLSTVEESNAEGDWSGWKIERGLSLPEIAEEMGLSAPKIIHDCAEFHKTLIEGKAKGDISIDTDQPLSSATEEAM